ncbi:MULTISPECIES: NAD(P)-dependent alcohol dehydrogenase [unclassified Microbacterium]|uniref:NAD(P)-dependent alcohol dehydrogenase n=1 Tax=unclassified Microbacterium TaxID=2609290 RepID=UPI0024685096|nr:MULTISPECIES: NAD(P)-dependent alcohol dehydrogenase [unclassified Microbacterium]MDH5134782.1 NAD(P)-dependent alcohol dehydrogenase [Microbacterium sp. RD10]MDH5137760.1 NAD(P)-dependent alcohol dehydrogenase [Microbacterium sp. RD11]MDH5146481.1 NAD(P)-dependent alcohol dehydrogenase [Microbacterium sp. RD12]MDH5155930.1 NAD(P)-dependent alcohol dehydrogenase [Microbacterium sp. RD06]MDH5167534.1 NAD(P)-dependent alcohol dehydrogenase [Microbacterium sp. RD02]
MTTVTAYAAPAEAAPLEKTVIERRELGPHDILIDIAFAGICHSDIHTVRGDWGPQQYPLAPGHEITGTVAAVGAEVTKHALGDRVGVGCLVNSCRECVYCLRGDEQFCTQGAVGTYGAVDRDGTITQGGYSQQVVVTEDFVLRIPDALPLDAAAPLLCAGITTYSPLRHWKVGPGTRVAVVGLGGLGHMGVQIAHALGAEVTVLSQTLSKQDDGLRLGADRYFATSDRETFRDLRGSFDVILNTVSAVIDLRSYLGLLDVDGTIVCVGAPAEALALNAGSLIAGRRSIAGSNIGGIRETQEMLDFCAEHGITAQIEVIPASAINEAYERVLASDVRYRFVIDAATFAD